MTKKKSKTHLFTVFGFEINVSAVLTTIAGSVSWLLITTGLTWLHDIKTTVKTDIPQLKTDVLQIKTEQARIKKEYSPELKK